jgi:hypothetical protein
MSVDVNYVLKLVLQVWIHFVLISYDFTKQVP